MIKPKENILPYKGKLIRKKSCNKIMELIYNSIFFYKHFIDIIIDL
jgi:hypothetical protein